MALEGQDNPLQSRFVLPIAIFPGQGWASWGGGGGEEPLSNSDLIALSWLSFCLRGGGSAADNALDYQSSFNPQLLRPFE